jgi:hypothetical protein
MERKMQMPGTSSSVLYAIQKQCLPLLPNSLQLLITGGGGFSQALQDAIERAHLLEYYLLLQQENREPTTTRYPSYPASYANIIAVAASITRAGALSSFFLNTELHQ